MQLNELKLIRRVSSRKSERIQHHRDRASRRYRVAGSSASPQFRQTYVALSLSHAIADGFAQFPLAKEINVLLEGKQEEIARLEEKPAADSRPILEKRLRETVLGNPAKSMISMRPDLDTRACKRQCYPHNLILADDTVLALKRRGRELGIALDQVLIGLVAIALAEARADNPELRMTLYMPMRDVDPVGKPEEMLCLGLFADFRCLAVRFHQNDTVVGALLRIREQLRRSDLELHTGGRPDDVQINVLHTDRQREFVRPYREFEFSRPGKRRSDDNNQFWNSAQFTIEEDESRWWIKAKFDHEKYPPRFCRKFIRNFRYALKALFDLPVMPLDHTWRVPFLEQAADSGTKSNC
jgi:hypothetical protein